MHTCDHALLTLCDAQPCKLPNGYCSMRQELFLSPRRPVVLLSKTCAWLPAHAQSLSVGSLRLNAPCNCQLGVTCTRLPLCRRPVLWGGGSSAASSEPSPAAQSAWRLLCGCNSNSLCISIESAAPNSASLISPSVGLSCELAGLDSSKRFGGMFGRRCATH